MNTWFFYFVKKSISHRAGRFFISASAVMLPVTAVTALGVLSLGIRDRMGTELQQYGANMIVTERYGREIAAATAEEISAHALVKNATFQVYGTVAFHEKAIEVIGGEMGKLAGYRISGMLPRSDNELMAGTAIKDLLKAGAGDKIQLGAPFREFIVTGFFEKGSDEDAAVLMPLEGARKLLGSSGVSAILINAEPGRLPEVAEAISRGHPSLEVKTVRQVAVAEERILTRIQLLMSLVTAVVFFSSIIALTSTMSAQVIERMTEIGLMKAIGATGTDIGKFFAYEAAAAGLLGAGTGFGCGIAAAEAVSLSAFGAFIPVKIIVAPLSVMLGIAIAVAGAYLPVRSALRSAPATILRGE